MNYKKSFDILENLYISLSSEYQNTINEYSMDFKQSKLDEIDEKSSKTKHVDLVEEVGTEVEDTKSDAEDVGSVITGDYKNEEKEADNKGDGKSSKQSNNKSRKSNKKNV